MTTQNNKENIRIVRAYFSIKNLKKSQELIIKRNIWDFQNSNGRKFLTRMKNCKRSSGMLDATFWRKNLFYE